MKILPFTLFILILFGIISISAFQRATNRALIYSSLQSHITASRALENSYQETLFQLKCFARKKRAKGTGQRATTARTVGKPKKRTVRPFAYKINFALVLKKEKGIHHEIARELLKNDELLRQLVEAARDQELERTEDLAALQFELRPLWLKLLRGDLLDQITVHPDDDPRIYVAYASKELLSILFDNPDAIIQETEKLKEEFVDGKEDMTKAKKDFRDKLKNFCESRRPKFQEHLSYDINYKPRELTFKEKEKQITLKRRRLTTPVL